MCAFVCLCHQVERGPSLLSSPSVRPIVVLPDAIAAASSSSSSSQDQKPAGAQSPSPDAQDSAAAPTDEGAESGADGTGDTLQTPEAPASASAFPPWIKSPERSSGGGGGGSSGGTGAISFSPVNSNLRDLTPSHTLEMGTFRHDAAVTAAATAAAIPVPNPVAGATVGAAFSEAAPFFPCGEEGGQLGFSRSLSADSSGEGGGTAQNPPPKKKVRASFGSTAIPSQKKTAQPLLTKRSAFVDLSFCEELN